MHRGATYLAPVVLKRLEAYDDEIVLQMAAQPDRVRQGISGRKMVVPAGVEQVNYPIFLPEWVQTDRTSRIVLNTVVKVADGQGNVRHLVNRMDRRITMNVEGALLKLNASQTEVLMRPGQTIEVPLKILRSAKFAGRVEVTLHTDGRHNRFFWAEPILVGGDQTEAVLQIAARTGELPPGEYELTIQAQGTMGEPEARIITRTQFFVLQNKE